MRDILAKWTNDAEALNYAESFRLGQMPLEFDYLIARRDDYYLALVGELFQKIRDPYEEPSEWARLGNALLLTGTDPSGRQVLLVHGTVLSETALYAAAAFYLGGYPASAYLVMTTINTSAMPEMYRACYELLVRPSTIETDTVTALVGALRRGSLAAIRARIVQASERVEQALQTGPDEWVAARLLHKLLEQFERTNIRAVLPDGESHFWDPLVRSLLAKTPPTWDFFPSQIEALKSGFLDRSDSFSLQMPTGAGKTALSEALLFNHLQKHPGEAAVLLVPFRSLASELRGSLVKRLRGMGLAARCAYGGTVPARDEVRNLDDTRALIATPEALSGLLSANPSFFRKITLVICDEGHILDATNRGIGLEVLLARFRARESGAPRFVFISAIVPNIEEINSWLGGTEETVVRSHHRPALAEFAVLRTVGTGKSKTISLEMHPHESATVRYPVSHFLTRDDFQYYLGIGQANTYSFNSVRTHAIASARKALSMGSVVVFAANKRGDRGVVGLAEELLKQLRYRLPLPEPREYVLDQPRLAAVVEYFTLEYGSQWIGTQSLAIGAALHHGDIPQESREVVEELVRDGVLRLAICTNTLAEGVNLPIRTLILYSVQRRLSEGAAENLLARDIKNLVGRAGRAGAATKGLVICADPKQWPLVAPVALQQPGEEVRGALYSLVASLQHQLVQHGLALTNDVLEGSSSYFALIDSIDMTLIDLASEEVDDEELVRIARDLSGQTFAATRVGPESLHVIHEVFELRARRVAAIRTAGRISWIRETGARVRMVDSVESALVPLRERWDDITAPTDAALIEALLTWAWDLPDVREAISREYRNNTPSRDDFLVTLTDWISGKSLVEMAESVGIQIDDMLGIHARILTYVLQVAVEQGVALLQKALAEREMELSQVVIDFPDHLRFGVPTPAGRVLAAGGVRHRRAAVELGRSPELASVTADNQSGIFAAARQLIADSERWRPILGSLVLERTMHDLAEAAEAN